ncbi:hypothetical protein [Fulvivirga kasyanovii]|uniref:PH domain-containing protein n=1 Tax=Fulvivirga kasyanovii TaxID=396812 RepID=A0ABW9RTL4_9BACT|nr:hypothetical protein [Fulvivirga kasyanovii]MTI27231.1 hypothetical protein [Fulvivirga kasyanovii]
MKSIKTSKAFTKKQTTLGYILLVAAALLIFTGRIELLALAALFLGMTYYQKDKDIIKIENDHLEIKIGALASTRFIKFKDITSIEAASPKKVILHYKEDSKPKKLRIPVHMIEQTELDEFIIFINNKLKPEPATSV